MTKCHHPHLKQHREDLFVSARKLQSSGLGIGEDVEEPLAKLGVSERYTRIRDEIFTPSPVVQEYKEPFEWSLHGSLSSTYLRSAY